MKKKQKQDLSKRLILTKMSVVKLNNFSKKNLVGGESTRPQCGVRPTTSNAATCG